MVKRLLIDATHNEEVRVAVVSNNSLEEFDSETANKKLTKGNIYLARVVRVEPSLQAAFVEYNNGRHGFLPFAEIHPDYYRIPVADRQSLVESMALENEAQPDISSNDDAEDSDTSTDNQDTENANNGIAENNELIQDAEPSKENKVKPAKAKSAEVAADKAVIAPEAISLERTPSETTPAPDLESEQAALVENEQQAETTKRVDGKKKAGAKKTMAESTGIKIKRISKTVHTKKAKAEPEDVTETTPALLEPSVEADVTATIDLNTTNAVTETAETFTPEITKEVSAITDLSTEAMVENAVSDEQEVLDEQAISDEQNEFVSEIGGEDTIGTDDIENASFIESNEKRNLRYRYKIQEVIKRRQIMLVQVVKEERGNKGASLTSYLSLPGRYCVLMPNSGHRIGGVSRKISDNDDRRRLRSLMKEFEIPEGMSLIVRTAGQERNKSEIRRDYEYLLRVWDDIREKTIISSAPELVYAEGDLIKRAIRDIYDRDVEEVLIEGEESYKVAKNFMKSLIPSHAKKVKLYKDSLQPIFHRFSVEEQIEKMHQPVVTLPSGGSIVINHTEALVAIDVNSGKSTRERNIDDTALKTNLEAAAEVGRQLRLRDIGGIVVIDFIDMHDSANIASVERKVRDALKSDRARIQVGRISQFGLLELSRQRLRPSLLESHSVTCPHCLGSGLVRSVDSLALQTLRELERTIISGNAYEILVTVPLGVDLFLLNQKRNAIVAIEERYGVSIHITSTHSMMSPNFTIEVQSERPRTLKIVADSSFKIASSADLQSNTDSDDEIEPTTETEETNEDTLSAAKRKSRRNNNRRRRNNRRATQEGTLNETISEGADEINNAAVENEVPLKAEHQERRHHSKQHHVKSERIQSDATLSESDTVQTDDSTQDAGEKNERKQKNTRGRRHPYQRRQHNKGLHVSTEPSIVEKKIFEPKLIEPRLLDGQMVAGTFPTKNTTVIEKTVRPQHENRKIETSESGPNATTPKKKDEPKKSKNWLRRFLDS
ncbi:MAG: Rne/Rng family ribonuclease [Candidatus Paracaedibacteraceae bacterium]|nr:Rne/Rng family ribonuclease [Candidatus Paracaedibacteraceae bacterium]